MRIVLLLAFIATLLPGCAFRRITRSKNITYTRANTASPQALNIFAPRNHKRQPAAHPVLIYVHGGNWNSGRKELYNWFGSRLARKGVVAVIIDYPLSPAARYDAMAVATAQAVAWVQRNIEQYGGDSRRVYISGHSAGGHLAALVALDRTYLKDAGLAASSVSGIILIDAAGLDMYTYLKDENGLAEEPSYATTFTGDTTEWKRASPIFYVRRNMPPVLIFRGGRTYPSIIRSNDRFIATLKALSAPPQYVLEPRKKHIPMITQFFNTGNPRYRDMLRFMKQQALPGGQ